MTAEHLKVVLELERDSKSLCRSLRVRGIVVGDFFRQLVARTLAQQLGPAVELHTSPFQFALSTKSECECVAHVAQAMTDMDPNTTLLSVDGMRST